MRDCFDKVIAEIDKEMEELNASCLTCRDNGDHETGNMYCDLYTQMMQARMCVVYLQNKRRKK